MQAEKSTTYELREEREGYYTFTTRFGVHYSLATGDFSVCFGLPTREFPHNKGMYFALEQIDESIRAPFDSRIRATVSAFILDYLDQHRDDFFLYVCSDREGKEGQRRNAFDRWFNTASEQASSVQKAFRLIEDQEIHFLYRKDRPEIVQLFDKIDIYNALPSILVKS